MNCAKEMGRFWLSLPTQRLSSSLKGSDHWDIRILIASGLDSLLVPVLASLYGVQETSLSKTWSI